MSVTCTPEYIINRLKEAGGRVTLKQAGLIWGSPPGKGEEDG